jgi:hypothetical protein
MTFYEMIIRFELHDHSPNYMCLTSIVNAIVTTLYRSGSRRHATMSQASTVDKMLYSTQSIKHTDTCKYSDAGTLALVEGARLPCLRQQAINS